MSDGFQAISDLAFGWNRQLVHQVSELRDSVSIKKDAHPVGPRIMSWVTQKPHEVSDLASNLPFNTLFFDLHGFVKFDRVIPYRQLQTAAAQISTLKQIATAKSSDGQHEVGDNPRYMWKVRKMFPRVGVGVIAEGPGAPRDFVDWQISATDGGQEVVDFGCDLVTDLFGAGRQGLSADSDESFADTTSVQIGCQAQRKDSPSLLKQLDDLMKSLGWQDPRILRARWMTKRFISEHPERNRHLTQVMPHKDASDFHTEPRETAATIWIPLLHGASVKSGTVWLKPGTHNEPAPMVREFAKFHILDGGQARQRNKNIVEQYFPVCESQFYNLSKELHDQTGYIPVEADIGDVLVFSGLTEHLSLPTFASDERDTLIIFVADVGRQTGVRWSPMDNYADGRALPTLGHSSGNIGVLNDNTFPEDQLC